MSGVRMEARAHIITCSNDMAKNIEKCVQRCGLEVDQLIFTALASRHTLSEVVEPRFRELFELAMEEIRRSGLEDQIAAGLVII